MPQQSFLELGLLDTASDYCESGYNFFLNNGYWKITNGLSIYSENSSWHPDLGADLDAASHEPQTSQPDVCVSSKLHALSQPWGRHTALQATPTCAIHVT